MNLYSYNLVFDAVFRKEEQKDWKTVYDIYSCCRHMASPKHRAFTLSYHSNTWTELVPRSQGRLTIKVWSNAELSSLTSSNIKRQVTKPNRTALLA